MPWLAHLCLLPADTSLQSSDPPRSSIESMLRRHLFRKRAPIIQDPQKPSSARTSHRKKRFEIVRQKKSNDKFPLTSNNYDMTILHDDELDNPHLATFRRRKKKIPSWATKDQLQLAIIDQVYFQETNPEDIFGTVCMDNVFDLIHFIDLTNNGFPSMVASRHVL